jgi:hypothetical protein
MKISFVPLEMGDGPRMANFDFADGVKTISNGDLRNSDPVFAPRKSEVYRNEDNMTVLTYVYYQSHSYMAVYLSLQNMLSGNITTWTHRHLPKPPF